MSSNGRPDAQPTPARVGARAIVATTGLTLATLGAVLPQTMSAPVIGLTAEDYGTTAAEASWALTVVLVVAVASTPVIGRLGDAFGARLLLVLLLPVVAVGLVIAALAPTIGWLIAGRAVQGLAGGVLPLAITIVSHLFPGRHRAAAVGLVTATFATGTGFGVVVSGLLVDHIGVRALSWVPLALIAAAEVLVIAALPHIPTRHGVHIDVRSALFMSAGLAALLLALTEAPQWPLPWLSMSGCLLAGAALLVLWMRREHRSPDPMVDPRTLARRGVWATHLTALLLGATLLGCFVLLPAFAEAPADADPTTETGLGASVTVAALLLLPASLAMLAVGPLAGILRRRFDTRAPVLLGAATAALGGIVIFAATRDFAGLLVGTVLLGAGIAVSSAGMVNVLIDVVPDDEVGVTTGVNVVARQMGGALGAAGVAAALAVRGFPPDAAAFGTAFALVAALAVAGAAASLLIPRRRAR
ncbi:MFS transporter [Agromyces rhizosphaerae]|uniref:MFS transporter n=1 Tax=Agromyces rhizosphaerae TaxID=88374 RepID=A0A9W6CYS2_9MICO|nr:MFS transporter [Agromyces rhizosphaerae]GLI27697.1 MFS transporter [Agromyces rhizosphaerae]